MPNDKVFGLCYQEVFSTGLVTNVYDYCPLGLFFKLFSGPGFTHSGLAEGLGIRA